MKARERVFIDTGAFVALAVTSDAYHERAVSQWMNLTETKAALFTSVPVVLETFTFLDRRGSRDLAMRWKASLQDVRTLNILECTETTLRSAWHELDRREFHKLSLVDATSFVLMRKNRLRVAFAFDTHFAIAGFNFVQG